MCGISFYLTKHVAYEAELRESLIKISHRGPDSSGTYFHHSSDFFLGMGHNRLSIVDLSPSGTQPMKHEDTRIIFNGEIYNYKEIRQELVKLGHKFNTGTDTEVILQSYGEYGVECFQKFRGMFAFIIFDEAKNKVFLVRDTVGIKPLYIFQGKESIYASSEIKGLKVFPEVDQSISKQDIFEFFNTGFLYEPHTGFQHIKKLLPGHYLEIDLLNGKTEISKFRYITHTDNVLDLEENIANAVEIQRFADVPVGIFFSGGADSAILATFANDTKLLFAGYDKDPMSDLDRQYAAAISNHLKAELTTVSIEGSSSQTSKILSSFYFVADNTEELISDYTFWPTYLLSKAARDSGFKVMLSGMGGDEVFAGYPRYLVVKYHNLIKLMAPILSFFNYLSLVPNSFAKKFDRLLSYTEEKHWALGYSRLLGYFSRSELLELFKEFDCMNEIYKKKLNTIDASFLGSDRVKKAQHFDTLGCLQHNLSVADKASMLASIELRLPLLDERVFAKGQNAKSRMLIPIVSLKKPLKNLLNSLLPKKLVDRPKTGFNPPLDGLINSLGPKVIMNELEGLSIIFDLKPIENIVNAHFQGTVNNTYKIWQLLYFSRWLSTNG
ncbi:asparagine synthase (glutamine-hydrolyzing) [Gammaproteobacteria bacterium]|nr:asparagine synthase (glutamine-hydrolyzing) [Gammaproteobacteria bacterium]